MINPTVYVVDDHQSVLGAMSALLSVSGYQSRCFLSPNDFLLLCPLPQQGCLVIDLLMPGVNGAAFMKQLRDAGCRLPVIMTSHLMESESAQRWLDLGVFAVLKKPFEATDLLTTIQRATKLTSCAVACGSVESLLAAL